MVDHSSRAEVGQQRPVIAPTAASESKEGANAPKEAERPANVRQEVHAGVECSACRTCPITGPCYQSILKFDHYLCSGCRSLKGDEGGFKRVQRLVPLAKSKLKQVPAGPPAPIHEGITCDGCGMRPIIGPRFMSVERNDYDLCEACCEKGGQPTEYNRIDKPFRQGRIATQSAPSPHEPSYPDAAQGQPAVNSIPTRSRGPAPPPHSPPVYPPAPPAPASYPGAANAGSPGVLPPVYPAPPPPYIASGYQAGPPPPGPAAPVLHPGIRCDGCGMLPIVGPRYQSHVQSNYDLCTTCCVNGGRWQDYYRHDQPPAPMATPAPASPPVLHNVYEIHMAPAPELRHTHSLPHDGYNYAGAAAAAVAVDLMGLSLGQHHHQHPHLTHQHSAPSSHQSHHSQHSHHHAGHSTPDWSSILGQFNNDSASQGSSSWGGGSDPSGSDPSGVFAASVSFDPSAMFCGGLDPSAVFVGGLDVTFGGGLDPNVTFGGGGGSDWSGGQASFQSY